VRCGGIGIALVAVGILYGVAHAQHQPPNTTLTIGASRAATWNNTDGQVVQLSGRVQISTDRSQMRADRAVIWFTQQDDTATIALFGNAELKESHAKRSGPRLLVVTQHPSSWDHPSQRG
jgi:lipopolysaccharide assembly outer membrane protein LptD (OstA)